jgi:hypothetical protein
MSIEQLQANEQLRKNMLILKQLKGANEAREIGIAKSKLKMSEIISEMENAETYEAVASEEEKTFINNLKIEIGIIN